MEETTPEEMKTSKRTYGIWAAMLMAASLAVSCAEEAQPLLPAQGDGTPVAVSLEYKQAQPEEIVVTRSEATSGENTLANLQVFLFSATETDGKPRGLRGYKWLSSGLVQDGSIGSVGNIQVLPGEYLVYGVANLQSSDNAEYTIDGGVIPRSTTEASDQKWGDANVTAGNNSLTLDAFKAIAFQRNTGLEISGSFIMSGVMNDGNPVRVDADGTITPLLSSGGEANTADGADVIKLRRLVSKITINVTEGTGYTYTDGNGNVVALYYDGDKDKYYKDATHTEEYTGTVNEMEVSFRPTSCQMVNIPAKGVLVEGADALTMTGGFTTSAMEFFDNTVSGETKKTYSSYDYYLPENVENMSARSIPTSWEEREQDNGDGTTEDYATTKYFTNAPEYGTYMVITGSYTEKISGDDDVTTEATPVYYIHLGDFGEGKTPPWSDFKVERNCHYTYNITVNGVKAISAEVEKDSGDQSNGAVEGIAINLEKGSEVFDLDSHYGQVNMSFDQTCVIYDNNGTDADADDDEYYVYFFSMDIRKTTPMLKLSKTAAGYALTVKQQDGVDDSGATKWTPLGDTEVTEIEKSIDWLEFVDGIGSDGMGASYPGKGSTSLKGVFDVVGELLEAKMASVAAVKGGTATEESWTKYYTCFVNENYYDGKLWSEFVNTSPRYAYICRDLVTSRDLRSISGAVIYGVTQKSIQTFYNLADAATVNAYGVETDPDDISDLRSSNAFSYTSGSIKLTGKYGLKEANGDSQRIHGDKTSIKTDLWNGWSNFYSRVITEGKVTEWSGLSHTHYTSARYSCMSRNRDLDGDGVIDDDEIRWYPPTVDQYRGLYIGENALDSDARLFKGNTADLVETNGYLNRTAPAYHYWSSTGYDQTDQTMFWSEGGGSTNMLPNGRNGGTDYAPWGIACVRNLPMNYGTDASTKPTKYYDWHSDDRKVSLADMNTDAVRSTTVDGELPSHAERGSTSYINKPASNFYVAKENTTTKSSSVDATTKDKTICADYSEETDGSDKGKWRAPTLMELELISTIIPDEMKGGDGYVNCRTHYSNTSFRCSWCILLNSGQLSATDWGSGYQSSTAKMNMRCVRDAD